MASQRFGVKTSIQNYRLLWELIREELLGEPEVLKVEIMTVFMDES